MQVNELGQVREICFIRGSISIQMLSMLFSHCTLATFQRAVSPRLTTLLLLVLSPFKGGVEV